MEGYRYIFKIILVGTSAVGKTSLIEQYTQGYFRHDPIATIGVDFRIKSMNMDGDEVKMQIWDPSGQERFRSVVQSYYRNAHAVVLVYDLTSHHTYENLPDWIDEIERHCDGGVLKILVGNKVDSAKYREVPTYVGREFALSNGFTFFVETSAWDASNVDVLFRNIALCLRNEVKTKNSRYVCHFCYAVLGLVAISFSRWQPSSIIYGPLTFHRAPRLSDVRTATVGTLLG